jgi:hypothetical protein
VFTQECPELFLVRKVLEKFIISKENIAIMREKKGEAARSHKGKGNVSRSKIKFNEKTDIPAQLGIRWQIFLKLRVTKIHEENARQKDRW